MAHESVLSAFDVAALASDPSPQSRAAIGAKVASRFDNVLITQRERELAEAILTQLAKDTVVAVRESLAKSLSCLPGAPKTVILALADDIDEIAAPILEDSPVLTDADLIALVRRGSFAKQIAIAGRASISTDLSDALVETDNRRVVARLMKNPGAHFNDNTLAWVADHYAGDESVVEPLVHRADLPSSVVEHVLSAVSGELQAYLMERHAIAPDVARRLITDAHERNLVNFVSEIDAGEMGRLIDKLMAKGQLTASLILRALCMGEVMFAEAALTRIVELPARKVWTLLLDKGPLGLRALFARARFPEDLLPTFRMAIEIYREMEYNGAEGDKARFRLLMLERLLTSQPDLEGDDLDFLLSRMALTAPKVPHAEHWVIQ